MELKAVKKYNKAKYPTEEEVKGNKELLFKPLDKWKKVGITSGLLAILLVSESLVRAMDYVDNDYGFVGIIESTTHYSTELRFVSNFIREYNISKNKVLSDEEGKLIAQNLEKKLKEDEYIENEHFWCILDLLNAFSTVERKLPDGRIKTVKFGSFLLQNFDDDFALEILSNAPLDSYDEIIYNTSNEFKEKHSQYINQRKSKQIIKSNFAFSNDNLRKAQFENTNYNFYESFISWLMVQGIM